MHALKRNDVKRMEREIKMDSTTINCAVNIVTIFLIHDSSESSSSSSDDNYSDEEYEDSLSTNQELEILYSILMVGETRGETVVQEKITDFVERVIPGYTRRIFKEHFRMYPETFEVVLQLIGPGLRAINTLPGRKPVSAEKQLLVATWFMSTPDSYRSVSTKFGIGKATAFRALRRVTYALHCIAPQFIQWPKGAVATKVMREFEQVCGFPNVIGAIDGTHIKIRAPKEDPDSYINRKGFHSMNVQVVCESRGLFTHCYAGHVGSVHDARVFRNSPVADFLQLPETYFPDDSHIIGDAAYGIHPHVMVPFRDNGHLTNAQKNFNYCLSSTRMQIERAIGHLKVRFRILLDCLPLIDI
ncbi:PREDICTED: putative nuclease HARBI1 [Trachymyrmex cornetzi]|uniref:putative nuclease HARBI1 n=1 Tax=Trachymyrmex cornetzi TaxID=471704 RepID=UPI00084F7BBD|nr:PREDICTED: putative nuclease HARBI1 [Trachymyrmex cornetzi]XP_018364732.1 PREDICTED: putative nuclease HARBI1 [Trachymyrmex cornetzi]